MKELLMVENLSKVFMIGLFTKRVIEAVAGISFSISKGKIISLVGESGSGKTTTAKMILRLERPTSGRILFNGKDVWNDLRTYEDVLWYRR
ncbi:MAG: ATP-binding cassette domain-containing protein, partial [Ignisphaera sp.]